jgi:hypothetical protein
VGFLTVAGDLKQIVVLAPEEVTELEESEVNDAGTVAEPLGELRPATARV